MRSLRLPLRNLRAGFHVVVVGFRLTFFVLTTLACTRNETMRLIGSVMAVEIFDIVNNQQTYDNARYVSALHALPKVPGDEDD